MSSPPALHTRIVGRVQAYSEGYDRDIKILPRVLTAIGAQFTIYTTPDSLKAEYGSHLLGAIRLFAGLANRKRTLKHAISSAVLARERVFQRFGESELQYAQRSFPAGDVFLHRRKGQTCPGRGRLSAAAGGRLRVAAAQ